MEKIKTYPKRIKLVTEITLSDGHKEIEKSYSSNIEEINKTIEDYKRVFKPEAVNFKISNGKIYIIDDFPVGTMFSNMPDDKEFTVKGKGFESYYIAKPDFSKVVRLVEI